MEFKTVTSAPASQVNNQEVSRLMRQVVYALVPGTLAMFWFFGWGVITNLVITIGFALLFEAIMLKLRKRPITPFLSDYSAIVTGWLLALALPPASPWWLIAIAILFSIVIAKHLYGGLGYNPFNPAMVGYAVVLISFPVEMTRWLAPLADGLAQADFGATLTQVAGLAASTSWDAVTMATPLDHVKTNLMQNVSVNDTLANSQQMGLLAGKGWEWVSLAYLLGGLWLLYRKIISWHIPTAFLSSIAVIASVFWIISPEQYSPPLFHLLGGATMLGAFFIATDPVSASTTPMGKLLYAAGIGFFVYIIRVWGGYPDGVAFAVIIMNMAVPLIDYYTQPKIFGETR